MTIFRENATFGVAFAGTGKGIPLEDVIGNISKISELKTLNLQGFNLTSDECLPVPNYTKNDDLVPLYAILCFCLFSCLADAYACRLRAQICNFFYPERAKHRAAFLCKTIKAGRIERTNQLGN